MNEDRRPNTNRHGKNFSKEEQIAVWEKADIIYALSPNNHNPYFFLDDSPKIKNFDQNSPQYNIRKDKYGAVIHFKEYGNRGSEFGWEIDHIVPIVKGGGDELSNLQPLHWKNNASKGDNKDVLCE